VTERQLAAAGISFEGPPPPPWAPPPYAAADGPVLSGGVIFCGEVAKPEALLRHLARCAPEFAAAVERVAHIDDRLHHLMGLAAACAGDGAGAPSLAATEVRPCAACSPSRACSLTVVLIGPYIT
jgi:hypothetical protein